MTQHELICASDLGMRIVARGTVGSLQKRCPGAWEEKDGRFWRWESEQFMVGYHIWPVGELAEWKKRNGVVK